MDEHTREIFERFDDNISLEVKLRLVGEHLVLATGAGAEILALHATLIAKLSVRCDNLDEIGEGMHQATSVDFRPYFFLWQAEWNDNDPRAMWSGGQCQTIT